jgi:hypothetical protein
VFKFNKSEKGYKTAFFTAPFLSLISRFVTHFSSLLYGGYTVFKVITIGSNWTPIWQPGIFCGFKGATTSATVPQCDST